jgi:hypothetical protein
MAGHGITVALWCNNKGGQCEPNAALGSFLLTTPPIDSCHPFCRPLISEL